MENANWDRIAKYGPVILAVVGLVIITALAGEGWPSLTYATNIETVMKVLGSLLVVALFLERAVAVINDLIFGYAKAKSDSKVRLAADAVVMAEAQAMFVREGLGIDQKETLPAGTVLPQSYETALDNWTNSAEDVRIATEEQNEVYAKRQRLRLGVGFIVAVLVACVGVRTLGQLVQFPAAGTDPKVAPRALFDWLDILLTAGLLAGGSNGIGQLIDAIGRTRPPPSTGPVKPLHTFQRYRS